MTLSLGHTSFGYALGDTREKTDEHDANLIFRISPQIHSGEIIDAEFFRNYNHHK